VSRLARFRERLEEAGRVHVDARPLAYHLLGAPRYRELTRQLFDGVRAREIVAQTSVMTLYQILAEPHRRGEPEAAEHAGDLLTAARSLDTVPVTGAIARRAAQVRARLGGRAERAIQIATALEADADLFLTQGSGLRRIVGTGVLDLDDYAAGEE
jgi:predicted nucleic acid-binding protein